jgi:predicted Zn-dependent peptidase
VGIYGLPKDEPKRYLARIEQVTAEEVREAARKYLRTERYWLGIVRGGSAESE